MEKVVVFKTDEQEILELINNHLGTKLDSIVANEELGNQEWVVDVDKTFNSVFEDEKIASFISGTYEHYIMTALLCRLCIDGVLEEGEYIIDCTW